MYRSLSLFTMLSLAASGCATMKQTDTARTGVEHSPHAPEGDECICLIASDGALRFRGLMARLVHAVLS